MPRCHYTLSYNIWNFFYREAATAGPTCRDSTSEGKTTSRSAQTIIREVWKSADCSSKSAQERSQGGYNQLTDVIIGLPTPRSYRLAAGSYFWHRFLSSICKLIKRFVVKGKFRDCGWLVQVVFHDYLVDYVLLILIFHSYFMPMHSFWIDTFYFHYNDCHTTLHNIIPSNYLCQWFISGDGGNGLSYLLFVTEETSLLINEQNNGAKNYLVYIIIIVIIFF